MDTRLKRLRSLGAREPEIPGSAAVGLRATRQLEHHISRAARLILPGASRRMGHAARQNVLVDAGRRRQGIDRMAHHTGAGRLGQSGLTCDGERFRFDAQGCGIDHLVVYHDRA